MKLFKYASDIHSKITGLEPEKKKNLFYICSTLFVLYFSYPLVRATSTAIFLDAFGAKKSPLVWLLSILVLCVVIFFYNKLQKTKSIHHVFMWTTGISLLIFTACVLLYTMGFSYAAYPFYIWKEVYIVLVVHSALAYLNTVISYDLAKSIYGPLGAIGSIGGILGGMATSGLTGNLDLAWIAMLGAVLIMMSGFIFWQTDKSEKYVTKKDEKVESPLASISKVGKYIFLIALVITLTQFCINLANFKFNLLFDVLVPDKVEKANYLGKVYSLINVVALIMQFVFIPFLFNMFSNKAIHRAIPFLYFAVGMAGFIFGGGLLLPVAATFIFFKGSDYSLFSAAKELLYFPLNDKQKYGAKYVVDMLVYRFAKGAISFLLIFVQTENMVNVLLFSSLALWFLVLIPLFREQKNIFKN